ncbi:MAG: PAS domain S-box protein [Planctomycetes bacterium]|nr:PAS domain S-box protein [Planctomycetota bacterium]
MATVATRPAAQERAAGPGWRASPLPDWTQAALIALGPPIVALAIGWLLWPLLRPFAWFTFFPAVLASAWLGGRWAGATSGALSTLLVALALAPPGASPAALLLTGAALTALGAGAGALRERLVTAHAAERAAAGALRSFVELAPDGIFVADLEGRYTDVNEAGCRMLGYAQGELVGRSIADLVPPEDVERLRRAKEHLLEGCIHVAEWSLRRKDGTWLPVEVSARILPDGRWQGFVRDVRERRRVELALHRGEDDLRRAQAVAHVGSWRLDVRTDELTWSDEAHRIFGVPRGARVTYATFLDRVHPDDREQVDRRWRAALRGEEPYDLEHRLLLDGEVRWVRARADLEREADGEVVGGIGAVQDITAQKRAEEALQRAHETEQRLRAELEALSRADAAVADAVARLTGPDLATVLNVIVLQARALTGAEYAALGVGTDPAAPFSPWISLGMPADAERAIGRLPRPVGTLGLVSRDGRTVRTDDVRRHPRFAGLPPGHPELGSLLGVPIRYRGRAVGNLYLANAPGGRAFSEEDERRVHQLAARTGVAIETATLYVGEAGQRSWLQSVLEQMPEAIVVIDREERLRMHNHAAAFLFHGGDPLAHELRDPSGARVPEAQRPLRRVLREGVTVVRAEHVIATASGEHVPVLISATPIRLGHEVVGAVELLQDIREQKELERLREEWTSIVAHDLRQPVGTIQLAADRLLALGGARLSAQERGPLERIRSCAVRLGRMIADLLEASRLEAGRLSLEPRVVDVGAVVTTLAEHPPAEQAGRRVVLSAPAGATAWADPDRLQQVLENLLSNAVKYGTPGADIQVDVAPRDDEVEVAVTNAGPGIPPAELAVVFNRFSRGRGVHATRTPGLGLGLYIAYEVVRAHGGRMWAESVPDRTTTFRFTLPRRP